MGENMGERTESGEQNWKVNREVQEQSRDNAGKK